MVSSPSPSWPGAFALMTRAYGRIQGPVVLVPVSFRAISSEAMSICQPAKLRGFPLTGSIPYVYAAIAALWHSETQDYFTQRILIAAGAGADSNAVEPKCSVSELMSRLGCLF
jgi:hypothetical protein